MLVLLRGTLLFSTLGWINIQPLIKIILYFFQSICIILKVDDYNKNNWKQTELSLVKHTR